MEIKYFAKMQETIENLFHVNLYDLPAMFKTKTTKDNIISKLEECKPNVAEVYTYFKGKVKCLKLNIENPTYNLPLRFLIKGKDVFLIKDILPTKKCDYCGSFYKASHTCSMRRRQYYYHQIRAHSCDWWEDINFFPIGSYSKIKRLFITYDVETYTWHGKFGKQLIPFMLVFNISGDEELTEIAVQIANEEKWDKSNKFEKTYYILTPEKRIIGQKFKSFRNTLQLKVTNKLWQQVLAQNTDLEEFSKQKELNSANELTFSNIQEFKLKGVPSFYEVYIIGHNINGFDEIVLAAQVISNKMDIPLPFKITRNFMPRNGKILFNDITFSLPNPKYKKRKDFYEWEQGCCTLNDIKYQYAKFMVRDTFALTHTSLRNAAMAYSLPVSKGCCPYKAVNEFYMFGTYQKDEDGFPAAHYWSSKDEYSFNKNLWLEKKEYAYDIIQHTLDYCIQDVIVTAALVEKLQLSYQRFIEEAVNLPMTNFNIFQRPTISSNSHAIFRQILYRSEKPNKPTLGEILVAPSKEMYDYVRASIRGGRCYPTYIGVIEEPIYVYDICGMYASALTHPMPAGKPLNPYEMNIEIHKWNIKLTETRKISYFDKFLRPGIFTIDADPPSENNLDVLPPFCSRKGGRLVWTNEPLRGEVATSIDLITLHNRGWRVKILQDNRTTVFPEWKCLAKEYVQLNIAAKEKADKEKNQTMRSIAKLLSNALYGSFATKLDNKRIVFSDQMESEFVEGIANGSYAIKSSSFIETDNFSAEILPEFVVAYSPERGQDASAKQDYSDSEDENEAIYSSQKTNDHVSYSYKPITLLDVEENDICLHTLEKNTPLIDNNRYASQIASFVLAWTRAFVSEWSEFLYEEDRGIPIKDRTLKSVYGDTDSLFLTKKGKELMESKGKKRIKKNGGKLVFDENNPDLTWLVECETICKLCGNDAYSPESIFLAPKLYALKELVCESCGYTGPGKLRAKGHATTDLSYDLMSHCYYVDLQLGNEKFQTSRLSLRRSLVSNQSHIQPFTVTETVLTRTLRPWKDKTLASIDHHRLIPYSMSNPNPRNNEICLMQLPWNT